MSVLSVARVIVVASTVLAVAAETFIATYYAPQVRWIAVAGFVALLAAGQRLRSSAVPVLTASLFLAPAILLVSWGTRGYGVDVIWILPMLGLILSDRRAWTEWSLPERWQWPLITWATLAALAWPIVFLREADFTPAILTIEHEASATSIGISPWLVNENVGYFAIGHLLGILWIDVLFRWYRDRQLQFRREVLIAGMAAAAIAALVGIYQGFFDIRFLNEGFWAYMKRASGTMADANKLGAVVSFWTVGAMAFALRLPQPWRTITAVAGLVLGIAAVWVSGSRTGLAAVGVSVMVAVFETVRSSKLDFRKLALSAAASLVVAAALVMALRAANTTTVVERGILEHIPFLGERGFTNSLYEFLWERFGYGPAAIQMVMEHPISGVGIGTYHALSHDYGDLRGYVIPQPDNAQAWWRHNFAELGAIGSLPLIVWLGVFGRSLFSRTTGDPQALGMLRGVMIAFFIASVFGVPSQSVAIVITFWTFVFWFAQEKGEGSGESVATRWPLHMTIAAVALVALHMGATTVDAFGDLRPRNRAQRFGWFYHYGLTDVEPDPGGNAIGRRWTGTRALAQIPVRGKVLKFVGWIDHPDSDVNPVHTQVWADGLLVYEGDLRRSPLFIDIPARPGARFLVLETRIDRTFRPSDQGGRDRRNLGLSIRDWVWE